MKVLDAINFDNVDDPVKTEETLYRQLREYASGMVTDYIYVAMPLAYLLNTVGVAHTQALINKVCADHPNEKLLFICQHIQVNQLRFNNHLVFSPHATVLDSYQPLPHYSCNYDAAYVKPWHERKYTFSFMGSFITHPVRRRIYEYLKTRDDSLVIDTGMWHFEGPEDKQKENSQKYIELLGDTKYSLCPRGTGPSSIRIWESMAMGACPVVISDFLKMPLERELIDEPWKRLPENFSASSLDNMAAADLPYSRDSYLEYFTNENLYKSVVAAL